MSYLIIGDGYLGRQFAEYFGGTICSKISCQESSDLVIGSGSFTYVINCAGKTGRPNIDWCENHKEETFFSNVVLPTYILKSCQKFGAKMIHIGSGCIYQGDNDGLGYSEDSRPNFDGSYYSWTKIVSERFLSNHDVLQLRIRMPLSDKPDPRNLLTKLLGYSKVVLAANSITYVPDLLFMARYLIERDKTGIYNAVNKGFVTHGEILEAYTRMSGKQIACEHISIEELDALTKAPRSNCVLSTRKIESSGINLRTAHDAIDSCVREYVKSELAEIKS